jgi:Na+-transporting NADH:ubiquinone oxidoreductase subunit C
MREDSKTLIFAATVCVVCSLLLSGTAALLKKKQDLNAEFDVQRNIVKAFGLDVADATPDSISNIFKEHITEETTKNGLPIYLWKEDGKTTKYAFPVSGKGLWSTIYGYLALDSDKRTVVGISFYKHGETPGLGAEIEKPWFQDQFKGKKLYAKNGTPLPFSIVKGEVKSLPKKQQIYSVDGISGATLTGKGVQAFLRKDLARYADFFTPKKEN